MYLRVGIRKMMIPSLIFASDIESKLHGYLINLMLANQKYSIPHIA